MAVLTFTDEYSSPIAPSRIFKASILDSHNLIPKLLPNAIKSIDIVEGNGGTGSIKQINFVQGGNTSYLKHRIDELNENTYTYNYTLIEGEGLMDKIEKISYQVKFESAPNGGTLSKMTTSVYAKGDFELKEEEIKTGKERVLGMYKIVEAYLLENPEAYV